MLDFDGNENYSAIDLFFDPFTATFVYHGVPKCYLFTAFINTAFDKFFLLKSDSHHRPKNVFIFFNDSPSKVMKNAFYFIFKVLFVLKVFKYMSWLFGHVEKMAWFRNKRLISKFVTSQPSQQTITIHIYCSISYEVKTTRQSNLVSW